MVSGTAFERINAGAIVEKEHYNMRIKLRHNSIGRRQVIYHVFKVSSKALEITHNHSFVLTNFGEIMKSICIIMAIAIMATALYATGGDTPPASEHYLCPDRIRNVIAVDDAADQHFYAATFGLDNYVHTGEPITPLGKEGLLISFTVLNGIFDWSIENRQIIKMNQEHLNLQEDCVSSYNTEDIGNINTHFTPSEAQQRVDGATGFWASPVLYKYNSTNHNRVILLNKSGTLLSVSADFVNDNAECNWILNLRYLERDTIDNSFKLEYMATPTLIGDLLYILGLHSLFIVDARYGQLVHSIPVITNFNDEDHFIAPISFDTEDGEDIRLYAVSKNNKIYEIDPMLVVNQINTPQPQLINCWTTPLVDNSGHVYFTGSTEAGPNSVHISPGYDFLSQNSRPNLNNILRHNENTSTIFTRGYKGTTLTDRYKGMYFFRDDCIDYFEKKYDFSGFEGSLHYDPLTFYDPTSLFLGTGYRYVNNHSALLERADLNRSVIVSISNMSEQPPYYPQEEIITGDFVSISYNSTNYMYSDVTHDSFQQWGPTARSWAGITPYLTASGLLNMMYADEHGYAISYPEHMPVISSVGPNGEPEHEYESVNPPLGFSKFQKGKDNVVKYQVQPTFNVNAVDNGGEETSFIYVNAYGRAAIPTTVTYGDSPPFEVNRGVFQNLLKHPRYTVTLLRANGTGAYTATQYQNIDIGLGEVFLSDKPVLDVYWAEGDTILTANHPLFYNKIRIHPGARLKIGEGVSVYISDNLEIMDGATITLGDDCLLTTYRATCNSTENTAVFQVDENNHGTGRFVVTNNMDISEASDAIFKGSNISSTSYDLNAIIVKENATTEFLSLNDYSTDNDVSTRIGWLQNRGRVYINDIVELNTGYIHTESSTIKINYQANHGHLIFRFPQYGLYNSTAIIGHDFDIGYEGMTNPSYAQLTIDETNVNFKGFIADVDDYIVYGTINILGTGECIVSDRAVMRFEANSHVNLNGGNYPNRNGAQLIVQDTDTNSSAIKFASGVCISGYKPDPDSNDPDVHGDRIITDENGKIEGVDQNPRKLLNVRVTSTHPNAQRWEGIYINTTNTMGYDFELETTNQSIISGIDKIYVKDPGDAPTFNDVDFINCSYGVLSTINDPDPGDNPPSARNIGISGCMFKDCSYGIYLENLTTINPPPSISASITNCEFGDVDTQSGFNFAGIALRRAVNVSVNDCDFFRNGYGIISLQSSVLVGGSYATTYPYLPTQGQPCRFYNNEKAGIDFEQSSSTQSKSLIYRNEFSGDFSTPTCTSGIGIWANESIVDVIDNDFNNLGWHGMLMKSYNWNSNTDYHGFAANTFQNNNGCELIGDAASLSTSRNGLNLFDDDFFTETHHIPNDPLANFDSWDKYILANLSSGLVMPVANMRGNSFAQTPPSNRERFYPDYDAFRFDPFFPSSLTDIIVAGMNQFYQGLFDESIQSMKQAVEVYPDSLLTKLAIDYLYLATRASSEDYSNLRAYLDLKIPTETFATYVKKEEIKTKCYIKEEDYLTAISRLQLVLDNPETVADSLFALIDQAYCYMNLANAGDKSLPNISIKTPDFASYLEFLAGLSSATALVSQNNQPTPQVLKIESNCPNPFNPKTTIRFSVPSDGRVIVTIYNIKGQRVKQILNEQVVAGRHAVMWNGTDSSGRTVSSGLYFARIEQGNKHRIHKMMLMK